MKLTKQLLVLASTLMMSFGALAQSGTWLGNSTGDWSAPGNWVSGTIASGTDATATFNLTNTYTVTLDSSYTIGTLRLTASTGSGFTLNGGSPATTLTFATSSGTPQVLLNTYFNKVYAFGQSGALNFAGNQGLSIDAGTGLNTMRLYGGVTWTGFSGTVTLTEGYIDPQTSGVLAANSDLVLGTGSIVSGLGMFGGRNQTIGALGGNSLAYIYNNSTTTFSTLTLGNNGNSATFVGTIGKNNGDNSTTFRSDINLTKAGAGTEKLSGVNYYGGTTTINGGTLLVNGQHIATITTTGNAAAGTGQGGNYQVNSGGTLGGTGTIKPFDTLGGTVMININNGGILAPGDGGIGTLTLDGSASSASLLVLNGGASLSFDLGAGNTSDTLKLLNAQNLEVFFNNNVINFTDLTGGNLNAGQYLLFQSDLGSGNTYSGLTEDGSGYITAGLSAAGLSGYSTSLQQVGQNIFLNVAPVPEPAPIALLIMGGLMLGYVIRRK